MIRCDGCMYWKKYDWDMNPKKKGIGECRKNPPAMDNKGKGYWPETCNYDGCYTGDEGVMINIPGLINE